MGDEDGGDEEGYTNKHPKGKLGPIPSTFKQPAAAAKKMVKGNSAIKPPFLLILCKIIRQGDPAMHHVRPTNLVKLGTTMIRSQMCVYYNCNLFRCVYFNY